MKMIHYVNSIFLNPSKLREKNPFVKNIVKEIKDVLKSAYVDKVPENKFEEDQIKLAKDVELLSIAKSTPGMVGADLENLVNEEVQAEREIKVFNLSREEAFKIPDLVRMKINKLPDSISEVRIVDISGLDLQADGGTHVHNTVEVGKIRVIGHESKGRINKRLRIAVED